MQRDARGDTCARIGYDAAHRTVSAEGVIDHSENNAMSNTERPAVVSFCRASPLARARPRAAPDADHKGW